MTLEEALTAGFQRWLEAAVSSERATVTNLTVDPYVTSMRYPWQAVEGMIQAESGEVTTSDPSQRFVDLQRAGLVTGTYNNCALSDLGGVVLGGWRHHGVLDQSGEAKELEFARSVVLAEAAAKSGIALYREAMAWWALMRSHRPAAEWFSDEWSLIAATYFCVERVGYSPYNVMLAAGCPLWASKADLEAWATQTVPSGWSTSRLGVVLKRIDDNAARGRGKVRFYQALEAVSIRNEGASEAELRAAFAGWGV